MWNRGCLFRTIHYVTKFKIRVKKKSSWHVEVLALMSHLGWLFNQLNLFLMKSWMRSEEVEGHLVYLAMIPLSLIKEYLFCVCPLYKRLCVANSIPAKHGINIAWIFLYMNMYQLFVCLVLLPLHPSTLVLSPEWWLVHFEETPHTTI